MKLFGSKKNKNEALNEFNQVVVGNSLTKDAWRRLKKNKMAVISVVVVAIYILLAVTAPILPIYPYDQIILDHQHLKPSFSKNAGELLLEKKKADVYTQAWRQGRMSVTQEVEDQLWEWIDNSEANKVWDFMLIEGTRQIDEGLYTLTAAEQRTLDNLDKKLKTDLLITVKKVWYNNPDTGDKENVEKLEIDTLVRLYAEMIGAPIDLVVDQYEREIQQQVMKTVTAQNPDLTDEDYAILYDLEIEGMSEREHDKLVRENVFAKIAAQAENIAAADLKDAATDETTEFPLKEEISIKGPLSADVEASRKHDRQYYLGTDYQGRDMLSRIIYGGQVSIAIGFIGTITSVLIGIVLGALAGYLGGKVDYFIMRVVDIMYGLPYMLLVIIAMAIFGRNILNLFFALAIISWLTISRMVRGQIMSLKNQEFIEAARSMGAPTWRIIFRHLVPNSLSVIIVFSTLRIPSFIMTESFLSFLGLGVQAPYASWGSLVGDAVGGMTLYPWKLFFPAAAMTIFLFAMNFLGDGLRDAFDPQSKNQL